MLIWCWYDKIYDVGQILQIYRKVERLKFYKLVFLIKLGSGSMKNI